MRTANPTKAVNYFRNQLESRLKSFKGSFSDMNQAMTRNFDELLKKTYELILKSDSAEDSTFYNSDIFATSARYIRNLLSTFGDKMAEVFLSIKEKNPQWTNKEINQELIRRTLERIDLIARTEIPNLASAIKEAQAIQMGYEYFTWHTKKDKNVGEDHKILEGALFRMDDLPIQGFPQRSRPNCRCHAEFRAGIAEAQYEATKIRQIARGIQYVI